MNEQKNLKPATEKQINFIKKLNPAFQDVESLDIKSASIMIKSLLKGQPTKPKATKEVDVELLQAEEERKEYVQKNNEANWAHSPNMQEYINADTSAAVKLQTGIFYVVHKPHIKKHFCFGAGQNGVSTLEEDARANAAAENARTNKDYFVKQNLSRLEAEKEFIEKSKKLYIVEWKSHYQAATIIDEDEKWQDEYNGGWRYKNNATITELSNEDRTKILKVLNREILKFKKRLFVYLKKYGLTKIHAWSFLVD